MGISPSGPSSRPANLGQREGETGEPTAIIKGGTKNKTGGGAGQVVEYMQPVEAFTQADCSAESPFPIQASLLNQKPVSPPATFVRSNQRDSEIKSERGYY